MTKLSKRIWMIPIAFGTVIFAADEMTTPPAQNTPQVMPTQQQGAARRVSKLMGAAVISSDTQSLGNVKDVVFDNARHHAGYIVISCDKVPGLADRLATIPYQMVQFAGGDQVRLAVDVQAIKNGPTFARGQWPSDLTAETYTMADDYYRKQAKDTIIAQPAAARAGAIWTERASDLLGRHVQTPKGEGLGDLKDIVLDEKTGDAIYGVLSFGGTLGVGDKYFAVPIDNFQSKPGTSSLVLEADKEQLKKASGFDKAHWPSRAPEPWMQ